MIRYLKQEEIDKQRWDAAILNASNRLIYGCSWYLDIVCPGWEALADDDYKNIFPLTCRKKYGIHYLFQPDFTQQLGLFSVSKNISEKLQDDFMKSIPQKFRLIEINLNAANPRPQGDFKSSERLTHLLDLNYSYQKIFDDYSQSTKRNLKRAEQSLLAISEGENIFELIFLFRKNKGKEIENWNEETYKTFEKLVNVLQEKKLVKIISAHLPERKTCAGAVFIKSFDHWIFLFSATNSEAKETGAMTFIIDYFIRENAEQRMMLDFEGSMISSLARFYKSFGSKESVYLQIKKNNLPAALKWLKK